ncbi:hypothetical protein SE91_27340 [Bradyrhizobium sp. DOA1]|nr:hypothetical protein SE91_27340 [Bradyrhizobium sp. DOA1]
METEAERIARQNAEREDELRRVPLQTIDKSRWPKEVRPIAWKETDGLGIDNDGRLYWNGKPVEIIGRRLDLTWGQFWIALVVAIFTVIGGVGAAAQGWAAYHDWACRNKQAALMACPTPEKSSPGL